MGREFRSTQDRTVRTSGGARSRRPPVKAYSRSARVILARAFAALLRWFAEPQRERHGRGCRRFGGRAAQNGRTKIGPRCGRQIGIDRYSARPWRSVSEFESGCGVQSCPGKPVWYSGPPESLELLKESAIRRGIPLRSDTPPSADEADELVSSLGDLFLEAGYDENYDPTPLGLVIESLIDGLSQYCDDDGDD